MEYCAFSIGLPANSAWWRENLMRGVITAGYDAQPGDRLAGSEYESFRSCKLRLPADSMNHPHLDHLTYHRKQTAKQPI